MKELNKVREKFKKILMFAERRKVKPCSINNERLFFNRINEKGNNNHG